MRHLTLVLVVAGAVMFTNLGGPKLWDRDEPRNAGCAVEMLERGDWVTPYFDGELRSHKPVLLYWFMMSAYTVFGVNEFSARFWSALLAVGTCGLAWFLANRLVGRGTGVWAGIILASSLMFVVAGRAATPDSVLIFFSTLSLAIYVGGTFRSRGPIGPPETDVTTASLPGSREFLTWPRAVLLYAAMGMAVLAKGPVGLVLPTAVIGMYLLIVRLPDRVRKADLDGQSVARRGMLRLLRCARPFHPVHFLRTCWFMRPLTAIGVVLLVALPWYVLVGVRTEGDWLRGFFLEHNLGRATRPMEGHDGSPWFFYPVAILAGFFPWSVFAVPAALYVRRSLRRSGPEHAGWIFCLAWVGVYVGLFSLASTKLPSYVTPCYPALAVMTGGLLRAWWEGSVEVSRRWMLVALSVLGVVGLAITVGVAVAAARYLPGEEVVALWGLVPAAAAVLALLWRRERPRWAASAVAVGAVVLCVGMFAHGAARASHYQRCTELLAAARAHGDDVRLGSYRIVEPSWVFYSGQPIDRLAVSTPDNPLPPRSRERPWHPKPLRDAREYLAADPDHFLITARRYLGELGPLPEGVGVLREVPYFLRGEERLVLVGRKASAVPHLAREPEASGASGVPR